MDSPHRGLTPRRRFWMVVFALVSLGVMAGGLAYYRYEQNHIRREKYQDLAAIADLKVRQILEWRRERIDDARSMACDPFLGKAIAEWLRDPGNPGLRAALLERLKVENEGGAYGNVLLADPDGRILLSDRPDPAPLSPAGKQALEAAVAGRQAVVGDLFRCPKDDRVHLDVAAAVLDPQGQPLAVVVLRVNADKVLYPLIQSWPTPSLTAETLLVEVEGKDILFLNELRHREKTALSLREPLTQKDLPAVQAGLGKQGVFEGRDYRGKKVLADLRPVPQSPWFMVAKVDADEILAEARYRAGITALFVVIFILLTAAVIAYGYRQQQANLYQALYQTEREQRQAQEEFRTTLYSIGDAVITTDTEGLVKHLNPVAERLTGWLEAEARGKPLEEVFRIINEETRTPVENPAQRVLREGVVVGLANHTLLVARDDNERPIADSGAPIRDENGAVIGVVLVFRDQTEERAAQNALRESEEHYRSLFDNMLNGFAYCKMLFEQNQAQDFIYLNVNSSFEILTGLKNVVGKRVSEVLPGLRESDPELFEIYGRVALTGKPERFETYVEALKIWFSVSVFSHEKEYFVAVFDVITERKRAEEALKENIRLNQILLDAFPCVALLLRPQTRDIIASNAAAVKVGAVPGTQCFSTWGQRQDPCPWCLAPAVWATGEAQHLQFEALGIFWDAYWIPVAENLYMHFAFDITERKRAEEALRESEEKYRLIVNQIPAVVFQGYGDWSVDFFDNKIEILSGYTKEEIDSRKIKWCDLILPEDFNNAHRIFIEALKTDKSYVREYRIRKKDGGISWIQAMGRIFCDDTGKVDHISGVFFDITDRKRAEERLKNINSCLLDLGPDFEANVERLTALCGELLGATSALYNRLEGGMLCSLGQWHTPPDFEPRDKPDGHICYDVIQHGAVGTIVVRNLPETAYATIDSNVSRYGLMTYAGHVVLCDGDPIGSLCVVFQEDVEPTDDDKSILGIIAASLGKEEERKRAEEAFQVLVNQAPMGIFIIQDGKFQLINPGFEKITGYTAGELLGSESVRLVSPDYRKIMRENAISMLKGELIQAYEYPIITKSGEARWVLEKVNSTTYQRKRATLGYFIDISERKSLEDQFLQAQKMEAVGTLAGGIAHDFNNILTAILGNIGLAVLDEEIGPRVKDRLAQAEAACLRAQALSQQLLTFAKGGAPIKKLFSVAEFLTESTSFTCVGSPVRCETTFPENLWSIEADPGQIGQVFQNLTLNAIQAMPTGGTIKVWAENLTLGTDSDLPLGAGRYIKISVQDQGMGIPAKHLPRIFDPYFTTKHKGSGLGLASTYAIIKKHHGHIAVESKPRVGTTFHIYLPGVERQVTPQPKENREILVGKGKILVMDDEEMVREVLGRILARLGYEAEFARDGGEAIEMFVQAHGSGQAFAAVILDLTVPGAMGGKETMARLLEIDPQVKAIVSSGYSDDPIMADCQKYGFSGVIAKPYKISELGKILQEVAIGKHWPAENAIPQQKKDICPD